ncbi:hypothetical protein CHS0354_008417 [Potamilus streckersoni]|uniref:Nephrin n=1 Tax=Potamilus streckersoni TaxID=2493646 RepID=A0AAE0VHQ7_9BIVA|nr:hypothetical protein CHS0354_008417 [Potamilus streckersoni]
MCKNSWCHAVPGIWSLLQHGLFLVVYICHITAGVEWIKQPHDTEVVKGQTATLECQVRDRGLLDVIWNKGGNVIFKNNQSNSGVDPRYKILGEFNLVIENATDGDDAFFSCAVFSFDTVQVKLTVLLLPGDPVIARNPLIDVYTENSVISLNCSSVGGNPYPTIIWYKNGQVLSGATFSPPSQPKGMSSSQISVTLERTDNRANFTCAVFNKANQNQPRVKTQLLEVQYGPYINFSPYAPYYVKLNQQAKLECVVDSNPVVTTVQWRKNGFPLQATNKILDFNPARKSDTGNYSCTATNIINNQNHTRSNLTTLYVIYAPIVTTPSEVIVNISQTVNITCLVDAYPPALEVRWENVDKTMMADGPNFVFQATQRFAGNYTCTAKNKLEPSGSASEEITTSGTTTVRVQYPPGRASITPISSVLVGGTVSLRCTVSDPGYPDPFFEWQKVGTNQILQNSTSPTYQINNAVLDNNGNYTCIPKNLMGTGQSATIMLEVNSSPNITITVPPSAKVTVPIEQSVLVLKNVIEGRPLPAVQWYKDGTDLTSMPEYYVIENSNSLVGFKYIVTTQVSFTGKGRQQISNNKMRIEDIGNYTCIVTSGATNTPVSKTTEVSVLFGPQISMESRIASNVGEMTVFSCLAQANPAPRFYWSKGGLPIISRDGVSLEEKMMDGIAMFMGLLRLQKTTQSDLGEYSCTVNNSIGQTTKKIQLSLKSTPDPPINLSKLSQTWESVKLYWEPGFDGGYNQSFVIYVNSIYGLSEVNLSSQTSFNVTGLMPQTRYSFTVAGKNIRGGGNKSESLAVQTDALVFPVLAGTPEFIVDEGKLYIQAVLNVSYCLRVDISKDGGRIWQKAQDCQELMGDFIPLALKGVSNVNVSVCLTYRPEVCGEPVSATIREPSTPDLSETQVIIIGCVCAAVLVILLIVLVVIICKRRQRLKKSSENETAAHRTQTQPVNGTVPTDKPRQGYENQDDIPMDTRNGYPPNPHYTHGESVPLDTSYDSQLEKQMFENEMNRRNANLNGDSYYNEKRGDLSFSNFSNSPRTPTKDPQQFINLADDRKGEGGGGTESGYSTPEHQKPKKIHIKEGKNRVIFGINEIKKTEFEPIASGQIVLVMHHYLYMFYLRNLNSCVNVTKEYKRNVIVQGGSKNIVGIAW